MVYDRAATAPTSKDVAAHAGVSQSTVSRVLVGDPHVSNKTRERVMRALDELNYQPHSAARVMKTGRTGSVGVVISRLTNPFYPELLDLLGQELHSAGMNLLVWHAELGGDQQALQALSQRAVDGVIFTTATESTFGLADAANREAPIILANRTVDAAPFDQIAGDGVRGGRTAAEHLLALGHSRFGLISADRQPSTTREREEGFRSALAEHGIELEPHLIYRGGFSHEEGVRAMRRLLLSGTPPTAVFCVNDVLALGAMDGAQAANRRVPEDVSVIGYDDIAIASWGRYDLTTVHQPTHAIAATSVRMLMRRITEPTAPTEHIRLPVELVIRSSTSAAP